VVGNRRKHGSEDSCTGGKKEKIVKWGRGGDFKRKITGLDSAYGREKGDGMTAQSQKIAEQTPGRSDFSRKHVKERRDIEHP